MKDIHLSALFEIRDMVKALLDKINALIRAISEEAAVEEPEEEVLIFRGAPTQIRKLMAAEKENRISYDIEFDISKDPY